MTTSQPEHSLIGTWRDPDQARALRNPGRKMPGSAASHHPKWTLIVSLAEEAAVEPTFTLSCRAGYDYRGIMSSSGRYDGQVDLTRLSAEGQVIGSGLRVRTAQTTHIQGQEQNTLIPLPGGGASDAVQKRVTALSTPFVIQIVWSEEDQLTLRADVLNEGLPVQLVRITA